MGRPIHKKYFGNRNIGRNGREGIINQDGYDGDGPSEEGVEVSSRFPDGDDGIGGKQVASAAVTVAGSYTTLRPTFTFTDPQLPGGVTATGTITSEVLSAAVSGTQTRAYPVAASAISFLGGTTSATFTATLRTGSFTTVVRDSATTIGFDTTTTAFISGTDVLIGGTITGTATIGGVAIASGQRYYLGAPTTDVTATLYATYDNAVSATSPLTIVAGTGFDGATFAVGGLYSTVTAVTPVNRGVFTDLSTGALPAICALYGVGLEITPTYRGKSVTITETGSGYVTAPTIDGYGNRGGITVATIVLATDTGAVGSATNQENAIIAYVYNDGERQIADIVKQTGSRRYVFITNADGAGSGKEDEACRGKLVAHAASAPNQADITATDSNSNAYWVTKLTRHKALLTRKSANNGQFATGTNVKWTFGNPVTNVSVQIENA
jgi:hypothetical protein